MATSKTRPPRVLFVTPEIHPLIKTGGLADVSGALPAALGELGMETRVLVPGYPKVLAGAKNKRLRHTFHDLPEADEVRLLSASLPGSGVPLLIIDCPVLYQRDGGPYQNPCRRRLAGQRPALRPAFPDRRHPRQRRLAPRLPPRHRSLQ